MRYLVSFSSTVRENSGYAREGQAWFDSTAGAFDFFFHFWLNMKKATRLR